MKLVIEIDEDTYKQAKDIVNIFGEVSGYKAINAIANGTPLDKHDEEVIKETVESIWSKPPYTELLDKIRAEIIQERESNTYGEYDKIFELCLLIIDKYKAESEEVK